MLILTNRLGRKEPNNIITGVDFHPEFQQIALGDKDTGEFQEKRLGHREEAEKFYGGLAGRGPESACENGASGHVRWLERIPENAGSTRWPMTPTGATYSGQAGGTTSAAKTFTLTNNMTVALTGISIGTTGDFAVSATTCTTSLGAEAKCTISVIFTPKATGTRTGTLSASDSASNTRKPRISKAAGK
ncbi:MAG: choice-of-anchor D domain-containing protein [Acidobacteriia bacterium]|nr:choice-of-anchor D domain-containing protein [Terriglobia bacterium]